MEAAPFICLACGELIIVTPNDEHDTLVVPAHPDRVTPFAPCAANARAIASDGTRQR